MKVLESILHYMLLINTHPFLSALHVSFQRGQQE